MPHANYLQDRALAAVALLGLWGFLVGGCASTAIQAQWTAPQFAGQSLRGAKVLVVCDAAAVAIRRICQDQITALVAASAVTPVTAPDADSLTTESGQITDTVFVAARSAGAKAIWVSTIAPDATVVGAGPMIGFGLGGFSGSRGWHRSRGIGAGVGVALPVGGEQVHRVYAAEMTLTDVETGRLMWTSTVTTPASQDITEQVTKLAKGGLDAAQQAGFF